MEGPIRVVSYAIPVFIVIFTTPSVWRLAASFRRTKPINVDSIYQDKDGKATEESMAEFSTKRPFTLIFVGAALGWAASFALAVFATVDVSVPHDLAPIWLLFVSWVCIIYSKFGE
jgi:hypothetical protein